MLVCLLLASATSYSLGFSLMEKEIVVVNADKQKCREICELLQGWDYSGTQLHTLSNLEEHIQKSACQVVIMDIDTVPIDNRAIRQLTLKNPGVYFLCLSEDRFHPELKEALCYHIYACIKKPVDPDELFYWLKSIDKNGAWSDDV
ncbi:MAG: hypothetical protein C0403_04375 [Desulfobacterium sp.]|nr:hypothetical protein [Desulfobacterium sp.]